MGIPRLTFYWWNERVTRSVPGQLSSLSGSPKRRLPGASVPSADRAAALLLLASEAWVGVSRRLRTPPSTVVASGLRATCPKKTDHRKKARECKGQDRKSGWEWGIKVKKQSSPCDLTRESTYRTKGNGSRLRWVPYKLSLYFHKYRVKEGYSIKDST